VDFPVEFPLGTVEAFRVIAPLAGTRQRFGVTLVVLNVMADVAIVSALYWGWGVEAAACYAIAASPLLDLFLLRLDLWSTAFATLGALASTAHPALAAIGFAAGAAFKLWPLTFLPLLIVPFRARKIATPPGHGCRGWHRDSSDCGSGLRGRSACQVLTFRARAAGSRKHRRRSVDALRSKLGASRIRSLAHRRPVARSRSRSSRRER
jgi:hypothetical protein